PQAPGIVTPQMPVPFRNSHVTAIRNNEATPPATISPPIHAIGVSGVSTIPAIFCVTDLKLWPGAMTAYSPVRGSIVGSTFGSCMGVFVAILCKLRIGVDDTRRISGAWLVVQVGQHLVVALGGLALRHLAVRIVHVAEEDRVGRAGLLARRHH